MNDEAIRKRTYYNGHHNQKLEKIQIWTSDLVLSILIICLDYKNVLTICLCTDDQHGEKNGNMPTQRGTKHKIVSYRHHLKFVKWAFYQHSIVVVFIIQWGNAAYTDFNLKLQMGKLFVNRGGPWTLKLSGVVFLIPELTEMFGNFKGIYFVKIWVLLVASKLKIKINHFNLILGFSWRKRLSTTISNVTHVISFWTWWHQTTSSAMTSDKIIQASAEHWLIKSWVSLGCLPGCAHSQLLYSCSLAKHGKLKKRSLIS